MAHAESEIAHAIMVAASKKGARLFKNSKGMFLSPDGKHRIRAGLLAPGSSDLIGFKPVVITADMVGQKLAVMVAIEVKTPTGRISPEQQHFIDFVRDNGGIAGVARSEADAKEIIGGA